MTLRETINNKVLRGNKVRTPEQVTDEILKLFEKLIDSKGNFDFENENLPEYCKTLEQKAYYRYGYWDALKELKEELKK